MAVVVLAILAVCAAVVFQQYESASGSGNSGDDMTGSAPSITIQLLAKGIATAEGFYVPGTRPARNHNPGDLTLDLVGKSTGTDGPFVVYASDDDGWQNLYAQIEKWLNGSSAHATGDSSIADISQFYTTTDQEAWAQTVASVSGADVGDPISSIGGS